VFSKNTIIIGFAAVLMLISLVSTSEAELWDLIILADMENGTILSGQSPVVAGIIVDHASDPVGYAQVHIRSGQESIFTKADEKGQFKVMLNDSDRIAGTYIVSIVASTSDGKTGIATTEFQVKGELTRTSVLEEKLSTPEAKKYLEASPDDFAKDPIGLMLYNYYQKIQQEYIEEKIISDQLTEEQIFIEQQKAIADELRKQAIEDFDPQIGIFSGYKYDDYIKALNPEVRDTIINQINFTKNIFRDAQNARDEVLLNGGTEEMARQAYLEKISITKDELNSFGTEIPEIIEQIQNSTATETIPTPEETPELINETESLQMDVNGTDVKVEYDGKTIFINVNGAVIEFFVNATGVYQVN